MAVTVFLGATAGLRLVNPYADCLRERIMIIPWERTSDGRAAHHYNRKPIAIPVFDGIACARMTDAEVITASFAGSPVGYDYYFKLWLRDGKPVTSFDLFLSSYPRDDESSRPDVCVRTCRWQSDQAVRQYLAATDKRRYVANDLPLYCTTKFFDSSQVAINPIMERTSLVLSEGVAFQKTNRPELDRQHIRLDFCDGYINYHFAFVPGTFQSPKLEGVIQDWRAFFEPLESEKGVMPDDGFQVTYRESIWEFAGRHDQPAGAETRTGSNDG